MSRTPRPVALPRFERALWAMPWLFALHVLEEWAGDFPRYAQTAMHGAAMSLGGFLANNAVFLAILIGLSWWAATRRSQLSAVLLLTWASGNLFWNFALHLWFTVSTGQFSPGLVTATLFYYPAPLMVALAGVRQNLLTPASAVAAFALGGLLMALVVWGGIYRFGW